MKKTDKNKVREFIRVDHAGERGAIKIYENKSCNVVYNCWNFNCYNF